MFGGCGVYLLVCLSVVCFFLVFFSYDAALVANKVEYIKQDGKDITGRSANR